MKYFKHAAVILFVLALGGGFAAGQGPFRASDQQVAQLLARLDTHAESYRKSLAEAIDRSFLADAEIGSYLKQFAGEFEQLTSRLKERSRGRKPISSAVQEVLNRGPYLDTFMSSYDFGPQVERDWQLIYADLNQLASYYKIKTYWGVPTSIGHPLPADLGSLSNRLIGTYELDTSRSSDVRDAVERTVNELPRATRRQTLTTLITRMRVPKRLAIDRHGDKVTLATSLQPARTYAPTGHAHTGRGDIENVLLYGNQFRLNTVGEGDSLYSVTYATIEQGAGLHVTRTALLSRFPRPLVVVSYYKKISDTPQLSLGTEEQDSASTGKNGSRKKNPR